VRSLGWTQLQLIAANLVAGIRTVDTEDAIVNVVPPIENGT
jgi:hypothetical protein